MKTIIKFTTYLALSPILIPLLLITIIMVSVKWSFSKDISWIRCFHEETGWVFKRELK